MDQTLIDQLFSAASQEAQRQSLPVTMTIVDTVGYIRAVVPSNFQP